MRVYTRLTHEQRYQIQAFLKAGYRQNEIATETNVHPSTISRERKDNSGLRGYRPKQVHGKGNPNDKSASWKSFKVKGTLDSEERIVTPGDSGLEDLPQGLLLIHIGKGACY